MPSRNVLKIDVAEQYYHVYARGASRQNIFLEPVDYEAYLKLFRRYLSSEEIRDSAGIPYTKLHESIDRDYLHFDVMYDNLGVLNTLWTYPIGLPWRNFLMGYMRSRGRSLRPRFCPGIGLLKALVDGVEQMARLAHPYIL